MYPRETHEQEVLFTISRLAGHPADAIDADAAPHPSAGARFEFTINRQREAALLHRNGRLRAIQALHRSAK